MLEEPAMEKPKHRWWVDLLIKLAMIEAAIVVVVGLICWRIDQLNAVSISNGLFRGGIPAIALGFLGGLGNWMMRGQFSFQYAQSAGDQNLSQRMVSALNDLYRSYGFLIVMFTVAVTSIFFSILAYQVLK
jgi:hypothetical protein